MDAPGIDLSLLDTAGRNGLPFSASEPSRFWETLQETQIQVGCRPIPMSP